MIVCFKRNKLILTAIPGHIFRIAGAADMVTEVQYGNMSQVTSAIMEINSHSQRCAGVDKEEEYGY